MPYGSGGRSPYLPPVRPSKPRRDKSKSLAESPGIQPSRTLALDSHPPFPVQRKVFTGNSGVGPCGPVKRSRGTVAWPDPRPRGRPFAAPPSHSTARARHGQQASGSPGRWSVLDPLAVAPRLSRDATLLWFHFHRLRPRAEKRPSPCGRRRDQLLLSSRPFLVGAARASGDVTRRDAGSREGSRAAFAGDGVPVSPAPSHTQPALLFPLKL
jgi:hypothetical protein